MIPENEERAYRIEDIIITHYEIEDKHSSIISILADVMHYCRIEKIDMETALEMAKIHFEVEIE